MFTIAKLYKESKVQIEEEQDEIEDRKPIILENGEGKRNISFSLLIFYDNFMIIL